jgi:hypothetical protein
MWLWSAADEYGQHRRRYARRRLLDLFDSAGLSVVRATSSVMLLLPLVAISRLRHRRLTDQYDAFREFEPSVRVNRVLRMALSAELRLIRRGVSLPLGSSLLVVGRKR